MDVREIICGLARILREELALPVSDDVSENAALEDIGVDSIIMMSLWVYAEEKFMFETDEDALVGDGLITIGDVAKYIQSKIGCKE